MCGGGGGGGGSPAPKESPAAAVASAPAVRSVQDSAMTAAANTPSSRRAAMRGSGRDAMRLEVSVANVGGSGATGLNIPSSR